MVNLFRLNDNLCKTSEEAEKKMYKQFNKELAKNTPEALCVCQKKANTTIERR